MASSRMVLSRRLQAALAGTGFGTPFHVRILIPALCLIVLTVLTAGCSRATPVQVTGGNAERGEAAIERYGCVACHSIPGIANPGSDVGPPLDQIATRSYIAGVLANTPDAMIRWLRDPPRVDPRTAMPNLGVSEAEARDMTAYLYTLN
jgi:cytochrome c